MIIAIDFDGTIVTHEYPKIGRLVKFNKPYASNSDMMFTSIDIIKKMINVGHKIVLFTMRSGKELNDAVLFLEENGVELFGVNVNPDQVTWTKSPKAYAQLYIDDAALGIPLITDFSVSTRPFVDWGKVVNLLNEIEL